MCVTMQHLAAGQGKLRVGRIEQTTKDWWLWVEEGWGHQVEPGRRAEALKLLSWMFLLQQVPALIAKMAPTINAVNYALGSEMVQRGIWQCLSPQRSERDHAQ